MRTIKFRYWNTLSKIMVTDPSVRSNYKLGINEYFTDRGWVWMQFTGFVDSNNQEIYDGDIIENDSLFWQVSWQEDEGAWFIDNIGGDLSMWLSEIAGSRDTYKIGNAFENPEYLK